MEPHEIIPPESPEEKSKSREILREWGFDVAAFESRARESMTAARGDLSEVTGALRQALTTTKQTLLDLHKARQPVAAELKSGFERAWEEIENAFAKARRTMRENRDAVTVVTEKKPDNPPES